MPLRRHLLATAASAVLALSQYLPFPAYVLPALAAVLALPIHHETGKTFGQILEWTHQGFWHTGQ